MKQIFTFILLSTLCAGLSAQGEKPTSFDGDHFSLEGTLELFKNSKSPEEFEKNLNHENLYINNLDLNRDGQTDYIMVKDNFTDNAHAIVLQVAVNKNEIQDIAVIEIEKTGNQDAILQIIGNEDVFGEELIVEPYDLDGHSEGNGPIAELEFFRITVNVWFWPSVRYIFRPGYTVWVSPWRWNHYPVWWKPWRPRSWQVFHPLVVKHHHGHYYHRVHNHRVVNAHKIYSPRRKSSSIVVSRTKLNNSKIVAGHRIPNQKIKKNTIKKTRITEGNNASNTVKKTTVRKTTVKKTIPVKKKKKG
ncbi:MAG: hypothetical protein HKN67_08875 [Saprospiraceae bacterium]|nr:hypothetical protein [Bacteroidia bacterium]MBT8228765.1 hypothetical protein [Bacteroidia bacterium]NNF22042.1 hypothetical protein [Saprospiraceae bacterium]NNK90221.1 hypothetical protein [Saprospiraceae bacterium]